MLSKIKGVVEHGDHFAVDDGSGKPFRVAKAGLSDALQNKIRSMYCGGAVNMADGGLVEPPDDDAVQMELDSIDSPDPAASIDEEPVAPIVAPEMPTPGVESVATASVAPVEPPVGPPVEPVAATGSMPSAEMAAPRPVARAATIQSISEGGPEALDVQPAEEEPVTKEESYEEEPLPVDMQDESPASFGMRSARFITAPEGDTSAGTAPTRRRPRPKPMVEDSADKAPSKTAPKTPPKAAPKTAPSKAALAKAPAAAAPAAAPAAAAPAAAPDATAPVVGGTTLAVDKAAELWTKSPAAPAAAPASPAAPGAAAAPAIEPASVDTSGMVGVAPKTAEELRAEALERDIESITPPEDKDYSSVIAQALKDAGVPTTAPEYARVMAGARAAIVAQRQADRESFMARAGQYRELAGTARLEEDYVKSLDALRVEYAARQKEAATALTERQKTLDSVAAQQFEAQTLFGNRDWLGSVMAFVGIVLGGVGREGKGNGIAILERDLDRRVAEQKRRHEAEQSAAMQGLRSAGMTLDQAGELLRANALNLGSAQVKAAAARATAGQKRAELASFAAMMDARAMESVSKVITSSAASYQRQLERDFATKAAAERRRADELYRGELLALRRQQAAEASAARAASADRAERALALKEGAEERRATTDEDKKKAVGIYGEYMAGKPLTVAEYARLQAAPLDRSKASALGQLYVQMKDPKTGETVIRAATSRKAQQDLDEMERHSAVSLYNIKQILSYLKPEMSDRKPGQKVIKLSDRFFDEKGGKLRTLVTMLGDNIRFVERLGVPNKSKYEHLAKLKGAPDDMLAALTTHNEFLVGQLEELMAGVIRARESARETYLRGGRFSKREDYDDSESQSGREKSEGYDPEAVKKALDEMRKRATDEK